MAGVVGWVDWNLLLDTSGKLGTGGPNHAGNTCFSHVQVLPDNTLVFHDSFWAMGHVSRFIPRGSRVLEHSLQKGPVKGLEGTIVERPDGAIVAVLANPGPKNLTAMFREEGWRSAVLVVVPGEGVVTIELKAPAESVKKDSKSSQERPEVLKWMSWFVAGVAR